MSKNIALLARRAGLTRGEFREYYEANHAPLAIGYFPFTRYVRNHLADAEEVGFDTVSEFWSDDIGQLGQLMQTEVGELMRADEQRFMDRAQIKSGAAEERLLGGSPRTAESAVGAKYGWLLQWGAAGTEAAAVAELGGWARRLVATADAACLRVTVDLIRPWPGAAFPFDAVLWFWMTDAAAPAPGDFPAGLTVWRRLRVFAAETAPQVMAAARQQRSAR